MCSSCPLCPKKPPQASLIVGCGYLLPLTRVLRTTPKNAYYSELAAGSLGSDWPHTKFCRTYSQHCIRTVKDQPLQTCTPCPTVQVTRAYDTLELVMAPKLRACAFRFAPCHLTKALGFP